MIMDKKCVLCILNQILRVSDYLKLEKSKADLIFKGVLKKVSNMNFSNITSPEFSEKVYDIFNEVLDEKDPYKRLRKEQNDMVLDRIDFFRNKIKNSSDPLFVSGLYSLVGNVIDYGSEEILDTNEIFGKVDSIKIVVNDYTKFKKCLKRGKRLLIIADNAGEAVFDMLFIERIKIFNPGIEVHYGVRSKPAINDVLKEDAEYIGLNRVASILETGSTFAGTVISRSTEKLKNVYYNSDIIVSKGQGNFETLEGEPENIFYVFKVKCDVVARYVHLDYGSLVMAFGNTIKNIIVK